MQAFVQSCYQKHLKSASEKSMLNPTVQGPQLPKVYAQKACTKGRVSLDRVQFSLANRRPSWQLCNNCNCNCNCNQLTIKGVISVMTRHSRVDQALVPAVHSHQQHTHCARTTQAGSLNRGFPGMSFATLIAAWSITC